MNCRVHGRRCVIMKKAKLIKEETIRSIDALMKKKCIVHKKRALEPIIFSFFHFVADFHLLKCLSPSIKEFRWKSTYKVVREFMSWIRPIGIRET